MQDLKEKIRSIPDFPKKGIIFRDVTTLLQDPVAYKEACDGLYERYKDELIDKIVAIDARGFVFGGTLSYLLNVGFVPVRKKGKLPYKTVSQQYELEYGTEEVEIHEDGVKQGERVLIVDDLIATGGTVAAAADLVEQLGGTIIECAFLIELPALKGRERLKNRNVYAMLQFEGE